MRMRSERILFICTCVSHLAALLSSEAKEPMDVLRERDRSDIEDCDFASSPSDVYISGMGVSKCTRSGCCALRYARS